MLELGIWTVRLSEPDTGLGDPEKAVLAHHAAGFQVPVAVAFGEDQVAGPGAQIVLVITRK